MHLHIHSAPRLGKTSHSGGFENDHVTCWSRARGRKPKGNSKRSSVFRLFRVHIVNCVSVANNGCVDHASTRLPSANISLLGKANLKRSKHHLSHENTFQPHYIRAKQNINTTTKNYNKFTHQLAAAAVVAFFSLRNSFVAHVASVFVLFARLRLP